MGIESAALSAGASAGASLVGGALDRREARRTTSKANQLETQRINQAMGMLAPGYQNAQNVRDQAMQRGMQMRQQGMQQGLDLVGRLYSPVAGMTQQGYMDAQRALLAGLPLQRAAIMGTPIDYSRLQPSRTQYDPQLLAGLFAGQELPRGGM
jgi:hypothetical protein